MIVVAIGNLVWCIGCVWEVCLRLKARPRLLDGEVFYTEHAVCARCHKKV